MPALLDANLDCAKHKPEEYITDGVCDHVCCHCGFTRVCVFKTCGAKHKPKEYITDGVCGGCTVLACVLSNIMCSLAQFHTAPWYVPSIKYTVLKYTQPRTKSRLRT